MSVAIAFRRQLAVGFVTTKPELYTVSDDTDPNGVQVLCFDRDFDKPSDNSEYVRGLGFTFNEADLVSSRVA
jgi:hypothetical protein